jgi:hypothetical protein
MRTAYKKGKEKEKEKHGIPYTMLEQTATQLNLGNSVTSPSAPGSCGS